MVPDAIYLKTENLRAGMVIVGEGKVEREPEDLSENRTGVKIRGTTISWPKDRLWLVRTDTSVDTEPNLEDDRIKAMRKDFELLCDEVYQNDTTRYFLGDKVQEMASKHGLNMTPLFPWREEHKQP